MNSHHLPPRPQSPPEHDQDAWATWLTRHLEAGTLAAQPDAGADVIRAALAGVMDPDDLFWAALQVMRANRDFAAVWDAGCARDAGRLASLASAGVFDRAFASDLARFTLANCLLPHPALEFALTIARRNALLAILRADEAAVGPERHAFLCALGQQCFLNEYAFWQEPDETLGVEILQESIAGALAAGEDLSPNAVAAFACYRPMGALGLSTEQFKAQADADSRALIVRTLEEPAMEQAYAAAVPAVTPIRDEVSRLVESHCEQNPYPRWILTRRVKPVSCEDLLAATPGVDANAFGSVSQPEILVAGCGTGSGLLRFAESVRGAHITAVDLSRPSLAYARRKIEAMGRSVRFAQADILELSRAGGGRLTSSNVRACSTTCVTRSPARARYSPVFAPVV